MAAARRPAVRFGPATSPPSRFPQVNYCDFATLLAALSATVASALSSAVAAALIPDVGRTTVHVVLVG